MKVGDKVIVKDNLKDELKKLTFDDTCNRMQEYFANTEQEIFSLWIDKNSGQEYASVDLCCEIPVQCLEVIQ